MAGCEDLPLENVALLEQSPFPRRVLGLDSATALTLLCLSAGCVGHAAELSPSASPPASLIDTLDARVPALLAKYEVASVGVALIEGGRVTLAKVYGEQAPGVPASNATLFNLASLTKPIAAETILRLASAGKLSLDEPMSAYWVDPDVADDPRHRKLTTRIALAHQTGLPNWRGRSPGGRLTFEFEPGTAWGYAGEGYDYAARFAEKRVGQSFEALAQAYVFDPLAMKSTSFSSRAWMRGRLAVPRDTGGRWGEPQVQDSSEWNAGNNLITTAGDYATFVASVMRADGLSKAMAAERFRAAPGPQPSPPCKITPPTMCPRSVSIALGWMRFDYDRGPIMLHTGRNSRPGGEQTLVYFDPERRRGVVLLTSGRNGHRLYLDILDVIDPGSPIALFLRSVE